MAEKILKMRDLQKIVEQFAADMEGAKGVRLNPDKSDGDKVPAAKVKETVAALKALSLLVGEVCQQPVLAVKFTKP